MPRGWGEGSGSGRVPATALGSVLARCLVAVLCCCYSALYSDICDRNHYSILYSAVCDSALYPAVLRQKTLQRVLKRICRSFRPTGRADAVAAGGVTQLLFERTGKFTKVEGCKSGGVQKGFIGGSGRAKKNSPERSLGVTEPEDVPYQQAVQH